MTEPLPAGPGWHPAPSPVRGGSALRPGRRHRDGEGWSNRTMAAGALIPPADLALSPSTPPRSSAARNALALAMFLPAVGAGYGVHRGVAWLTGLDRAGYAATALFVAGLVAWLAPKVSYRRRDAVWVAAVPYSALYLGWRFARRLAYLPHRDWPPRDDEAPGWIQVSHPTEPGALLYVQACDTAPAAQLVGMQDERRRRAVP
ncbi:hypothetical protein F4553_007234 [Allocatelliglobosispora scoriae]|uniref:Uncharacterized protein n=1 Tax=Allocatelliglobosispora scoriae TaxID=643052 RepID=A0A841C4A4_9ACTN|nr:hypothetical protein [Allocatelliglobosispora scoriae]MBB5873800.1 hypothetical protein [Allocatelliglobosispora scoriae]